MKDTDAFGLDIGTTLIKVVWLGKAKENLILRSCLSSPTPPRGMWSESPFDQEQMAQAIQKLIIDAGITTNYAHIALSDDQVYIKVLDIPKLSDKELENAVYWEAEQYIPAPLSTITLAHQILRRPESNEEAAKMQVLLVGAPTHLIQKYQHVLELAGVSLLSIETEMISVVRAIGVTNTSPTALILTIGALSTSLSITQKGIIVFTYSIPVGGVAMNRAIATDFAFTIDQAEQYKRTYGISDQNLGAKIGKAIEPILKSILSEVKKAITFYNEKYKNDLPISQILLAGGTAKLPGIDLFFVQNVDVETIVVNPWKVRAIGNVPKDLENESPIYTVATGLALKDYEK